MAKIEIVLQERVEDPQIRNIQYGGSGTKLIAEGFEELTLLSATDVEKLCSLPVDQVTLLEHPVGEISTPAGVYLLQGGATVHVTRRNGASVKFRQVSVSVTVNAPTVQSFMDTFALTMNNKLRGLELVPSDTPTYEQIAEAREL